LTNDDHWNRLAYELGLEPEPPRPATKADAAPPRVEPPDLPIESLDDADEAVSEGPSASPRGRRRRSSTDRQAESTALTQGEPPAEPDLLDDEPPGRPRRGRKAHEEPADQTGVPDVTIDEVDRDKPPM